MTSKFEKLIEHVINDEEKEAQELFHEIVVETSREIYENLMDEEVVSEEDESDNDEEKVEEGALKNLGIKVQDALLGFAEEIQNGMHSYDAVVDELNDMFDDVKASQDRAAMEAFQILRTLEPEDFGPGEGGGPNRAAAMAQDAMDAINGAPDDYTNEGAMNDGDAADDLITDVETEEEGMSEGEGDNEDDIEDRVVDLEDKLDELMAEFEAMMNGDEAGEEEEFDMDAGGDAIEMDDTEEMMPEMGMMENVDLKAAPKPVTTEPAGTNSKSTVAANSGAKGMAASPVKMTGDTAQGRSAPAVKDMGMTTSPAQGAAPKPVTTQAAGVNTKSPV